MEYPAWPLKFVLFTSGGRRTVQRGHANPAFGGQPGYGHGQPGYGHHGHDQHGHHGHHGHRSGPGIGGMVAAGAAGVVGGMIIGEMMDDAFEDDGGGDMAFEE